MCIVGSVGQGGQNTRADVRIVQLLLNMNHPQVTGPLVPDGSCGPATIGVITQFQQGVIGGTDAPGMVVPNGTTLQALRGGMPPEFAESKMDGMYADAATATVTTFFAALLAGMQKGGIDTPLRQAHFLAQLGHESGELRYTQELASGQEYEGNVKNLGNTQPGDGPLFKGRGLIQLTGRANYTSFMHDSGVDVVSNPTIVATSPQLCVDVSVWFWNKHGLNALADADDVLNITLKINGGTKGLPDREALLARTKWFLMAASPDAAENSLAQAISAVGAAPAS